MTSLNAFKKLDQPTRMAIIDRVIFRKHRYTGAKPADPTGKILLVGDKPAPSAPTAPDFHYTPFGALWHSSLFINKALHDGGIPEDLLFWENAYTLYDEPRGPEILQHKWGMRIALGGAAHRWMTKHGVSPDSTVFHPAAWKRFHPREPYPLILELQNFIAKS